MIVLSRFRCFRQEDKQQAALLDCFLQMAKGCQVGGSRGDVERTSHSWAHCSDGATVGFGCNMGIDRTLLQILRAFPAKMVGLTTARTVEPLTHAGKLAHVRFSQPLQSMEPESACCMCSKLQQRLYLFELGMH